MKARPYYYIDIKTLKVTYGVQAYAFGKWMPAARNGIVLMFDTQEERDVELAAIRRQIMEE